MIGAFIGHPIGGADRITNVVYASVGSAAGLATATGVGASTASSAGTSAGAATVAATGAGVLSAAGSAAGTATVAGVGQPFFTAVGTAVGVATVTGVSIILPFTSRRVLQDPVDCVIAGQQNEFRKARANFGALRGIFRE